MGKNNSISTRRLLQKVGNYINSNANKDFSVAELKDNLGVGNSAKEIKRAAEILVDRNQVFRTPSGTYTFPNTKKQRKRSRHQESKFQKDQRESQGKLHKGIVDKTRSGAAFVVIEELEKDIFIPPRRMNTALHRDEVEINIIKRGKRKPEGEITKVIRRDRDRFVGKLVHQNKFCIVETEDGKTHFDVKVFDGAAYEIPNGTIVVVKISKWPERKGQVAIGEITTALGEAGSNDIEMNSILIQKGFNLKFPDAVVKESEAIPEKIRASDLENRKDIRHISTFTIDPATAKDFDDAISYQILENGAYEVGIHIADVTHYLEENSPMDEEAKERTTSVYLVDRVNPMLPERLSNHLCSLVPKVDRLAFSAMFTFNQNHKLVKKWFGKTIIHSNERFTYEEAYDIIRGEASHPLSEEIQAINLVSHRLREKRYNEGSISFETDEVQFELDDDGKPIEIHVKERNDAHMLVEDLMLLANKEVAAFIINKEKEGKNIPFLYRVHDTPDPEKIEDFAAMAKEVGFQFDASSPDAIANSFNTLVEKARHDEALKILEPLAIRTMAKAIYSVENIGHYGLGFENYAHFTSPIRRYADVWVHRILHEQLQSNPKKRDRDALKRHARYISDIERRAQEAERESIRYKKAEFLEHQVGAIMPGYVSGVIEKGVFVELEGSMAEGLVPFSTLDEPFFVEPRKYRATGKKTSWVLKMGTRVNVKILGVDLTRREIDMELVSMIDEN
ncbi:MAG: ribonuclease R [Bacteroidetes bacterium]|jgi:ribonuclease R|nr:ribonuclease R [Bacteroidota bacterium]